MWEEFHGVGDSCDLGLWNVTLVVSVVVHGWANIETSACMLCPSASFTGSVMDGNFSSLGDERCLFVVKGAVD